MSAPSSNVTPAVMQTVSTTLTCFKIESAPPPVANAAPEANEKDAKTAAAAAPVMQSASAASSAAVDPKTHLMGAPTMSICKDAIEKAKLPEIAVMIAQRTEAGKKLLEETLSDSQKLATTQRHLNDIFGRDHIDFPLYVNYRKIWPKEREFWIHFGFRYEVLSPDSNAKQLSVDPSWDQHGTAVALKSSNPLATWYAEKRVLFNRLRAEHALFFNKHMAEGEKTLTAITAFTKGPTNMRFNELTQSAKNSASRQYATPAEKEAVELKLYQDIYHARRAMMGELEEILKKDGVNVTEWQKKANEIVFEIKKYVEELNAKHTAGLVDVNVYMPFAFHTYNPRLFQYAVNLLKPELRVSNTTNIALALVRAMNPTH